MWERCVSRASDQRRVESIKAHLLKLLLTSLTTSSITDVEDNACGHSPQRLARFEPLIRGKRSCQAPQSRVLCGATRDQR
jgi:hypothetical protein